ncbi:hypothetical protein [Iodobacter fluviatilis]|uniref:Transcription factor zinc-finger domain-containing protein n=1 Tax=Iodobacter fluviatilis TaxID=537 RepID=A0A7G3GDH6_9NEIS|nr:hypothetical protein [Iodobacter fluviatilis]QBC45218.1 hypothetical protein C1H71_17885 [Iodobacter fluviatilis]
MICPRCEQDEIKKIKIKEIDKYFFLCPECDATWFSIDEVGVTPFVDFETYMEESGFLVSWDNLENL